MKKNENKRLEYLIEEAVLEVIERLDEQLDYENINEMSFSEYHRKKMKKLLKKEKGCKNIILLNQLAKKVAIVLIIFIIASFVFVFNVEAWRARFLNYIIEKTDSYIEFDFNLENIYSNEKVSLQYVPMDFEKIKENLFDDIMMLKFARDEKYFSLYISSSEGKMQVDTENAEIENIEYNNKEILAISKSDKISLVWQDEYYSYVLYGNIEKEELLKIAYNTKKNL